MTKLTFSVFPDVWSKVGDPQTLSWEQWVSVFSRHTVIPSADDEETLNSEKKKATAVFLGKTRGGHKKKDIETIEALSLDIDDKPEEIIDKVLNNLANFEWVAYSTHKHGSKCANGFPRLRVIFPLSSPIRPDLFFDVWDGLNELTNRISDQSIRDVARINFLPSTFSDKIEKIVHWNKGEFISPDYLSSVVPKKENVYDPNNLYDIRDVFCRVKKSHPLKSKVHDLLEGSSLGDPGTRHSTILSLTMYLAHKRPLTAREDLEELFRPSMEASGIPDRLSEVWTAFEGALEKIKEDHGITNDTYSEGELEHIAKVQGCTIEDLERRWIIQKGGGGWILDETGNYLGPYPFRDFISAIRKILRRAPVDLYTITQNGIKKRDLSELVVDYGSIALFVQADLTLSASTFDANSHTFFEAVTPVRSDLSPTYDEEIAHWLDLFSNGNTKIIDYLSAAPDLNNPLCAVYFDGAKGSGKTLLVQGLARIWSKGGAAKLSQVFSNFNSVLTQCPIVFADEYLPKKNRNDPITEKLRELIGSSSRELTRKHTNDATLNGQIRLLMAANNEFLLQDVHLVSQEDREAVAQRFLYHKVDKKAADYLEGLSKEKKRGWLERGIAEHVLWLHENHEIKNPGKRFVVDGDESEIHRMLLTGGYWSRIVCEWLVRYLDNPDLYDRLELGYVRIHEGELLCNPQAITDYLTTYLKHTKIQPETPKIGEAIRALAKSNERVQLRYRSTRIRYLRIDLDPLLDWAERYGIGDSEQMQATLRGEVHPPRVLGYEEKELDYDA